MTEKKVEFLNEYIELRKAEAAFFRKYIDETFKPCGVLDSKELHIFEGIETLAKAANKDLHTRQIEDRYAERYFTYNGYKFHELEVKGKDE